MKLLKALFEVVGEITVNTKQEVLIFKVVVGTVVLILIFIVIAILAWAS